MFREGASLLKVGVIVMALATALVICAVVVSVALRGEGGQAAEVATKLLGEPPWYSFGAEGNAAAKSSSGDESPGGDEAQRYSSSGEGSSRQGSSSDSGGPSGHSEGEAGQMQRVAAASEVEAEGSADPRSAEPRSAGQRTASGTSPGSGSQSRQNRAELEDQFPPAGQRTPSGASSGPQTQSRGDQTNQGDQFLPAAEEADWPRPTQREIRRANSPRHYELIPGAVMGLTIEAIGIYDAPVFDSDGPDALASGVAHVPGTSWPWSNTPQRNVYLAGHRMGFRGTWSRMLFYNLDELGGGDRIVLRDRSGRSYEYRVSEVFLAEPTDAWVMGQVRGRDMVSLQTCTPIPTFEKRLIVRADRV
jgi:sortase A